MQVDKKGFGYSKPINFLQHRSVYTRKKILNQLFKQIISPSAVTKLFLVAKSEILPVCKILYYLLIYKNSDKKRWCFLCSFLSPQQPKQNRLSHPKVFWPPFLITVGVETTKFYQEAEAQDSSFYH